MNEPSETQRRVFGEGVTRELISSFDPAPMVSSDDDFSSDMESSFENEVFVSDAQQQWEENMRQLEVAVFFVLCPVIGRLIGRKTSHALWIRFVTWRWKSAQSSNLLEQFSVSK